MMVLALSFPVLLFPVPLSLLPVFPVLPSLAPVFPVLLFPVKEADTLDETERGAGGFGSTGKGV